MKNILYATDCSSSSAFALRYAYRLSSAMQAQLHVLHVYDLKPFVTASLRSRGRLEENFAREQLAVLENYCTQELEHELLTQPPNCLAEENDSVAAAILDVVDRIDADMVLVGMKTSKSLRGFFAGNIANELLNKIPVPMLILPAQVYYQGFSTLLYATDFEALDINAIQKLVALATPYGALIKIVHVPSKDEISPKKQLERFKTMVKDKINYPEMVFTMISSKNITSGLLESIEKEMPEVLVMLEREHHHWYDRLFRKDMVRSMEDEIAIPLLVFNSKNIRRDPADSKNSSTSMQMAG